MACDIQNAYLTAECREKIWTQAGPEFGSESGLIMIVKNRYMALRVQAQHSGPTSQRSCTTLDSYPLILTQMCGADQLLSLMVLSIMNIYSAMWTTYWPLATMHKRY